VVATAVWAIVFGLIVYLVGRLLSSLLPPWDWRASPFLPKWVFWVGSIALLLAMSVAGLIVGWLFRGQRFFTTIILVSLPPMIYSVLFVGLVTVSDKEFSGFTPPLAQLIVETGGLMLTAIAASVVGAYIGTRLSRRARAA